MCVVISTFLYNLIPFKFKKQRAENSEFKTFRKKAFVRFKVFYFFLNLKINFLPSRKQKENRTFPDYNSNPLRINHGEHLLVFCKTTVEYNPLNHFLRLLAFRIKFSHVVSTRNSQNAQTGPVRYGNRLDLCWLTACKIRRQPGPSPRVLLSVM